jgi:hypothetical protein
MPGVNLTKTTQPVNAFYKQVMDKLVFFAPFQPEKTIL